VPDIEVEFSYSIHAVTISMAMQGILLFSLFWW